MSDTDPQIETLGHAQPPSLSPETIAYQQGLLADAAFLRDHPQHAAMLRATLDAALAATGWQPPPPDARSPAQALHDQRAGIAFGSDGKALLPDYLEASIKQDATGAAPDPRRVARQLTAAGLDPETVLADAKCAIERAGHGIKTEQLGAHALAQLGVFGAHLRRAAASRPQ